MGDSERFGTHVNIVSASPKFSGHTWIDAITDKRGVAFRMNTREGHRVLNSLAKVDHVHQRLHDRAHDFAATRCAKGQPRLSISECESRGGGYQRAFPR